MKNRLALLALVFALAAGAVATTIIAPQPAFAGCGGSNCP